MCTDLHTFSTCSIWFNALDHANYAWWIPVHLKDMAELPNRHPVVATEFNDGKFVVHKTQRIFSGIPIDQLFIRPNNYLSFGRQKGQPNDK